MVLCGGFAGVVRAKKMRQDDGAEFISASKDILYGLQMKTARPCGRAVKLFMAFADYFLSQQRCEGA